MSLTRLQALQVRNLTKLSLQQLGQFNVFFGSNGAGKTSILESIYLLGMGRSFRAGSHKSLITHTQDQCTVYGEFHTDSDIHLRGARSLGVQRQRNGEIVIKIGGKPARSLAELAEQFPLLVINSDSFDLLTGPPGRRRQFIDWGVFHVEQAFFREWQRFQRCLKQRNKLLRRGKISDQELLAWSRDLIAAGTAVSEYREAYFARLIPWFRTILRQLAPSLGEIELQYRRGWDKSMSYQEALEQGMAVDKEQGYTRYGPQRADIRVLYQEHSAAETLSRGQQKLLVCALKLAQGQLMTDTVSGICTYLVDDLPAELDSRHSELVCRQLSNMKAQVFITCVQPEDIQSVWPSEAELSLFHVEQGTVQPVKSG